MKKILLPFALLIVVFASRAFANGVGVVDATTGEYVWLVSSRVEVSVENQVALVTARHVFRNQFFSDIRLKYAFPMPDGASATGLRWQMDGVWYQANFAAAEADTTLPGSGSSIHPDLLRYLGPSPLFFDIEQKLARDALITVEITYVQLLPYEFGNVEFTYPNEYESIQSRPLDEQSFDFVLNSGRTILDLDLLSHSSTSTFNNGASAVVRASLTESRADRDYHVRYTINPEELGLFDFSTQWPDSLGVDNLGDGFFLFVAEPDPSENNEAVDKVFTLIVDRSGSMTGNKIIQARNAASFIVNNLNQGDRFNIVDFSDNVASFREIHVPYNGINREAALDYIAGFRAQGSTNISGAFGTAIPQFAATNDSTANIIVFLTDGKPTIGLTNPDDILLHVRELKTEHATEPLIFTFGVGPDVNRQLLTRLATENDGLVEFLGSAELETRITQFYEKIRNPVVLGTQIAFSLPTIAEVYPDPLPNLYKGQQMIVSGRYNEPVPVEVTLSGTAFGQPVDFSYTLNLADSNATAYQFLPKIWAKLKIEHLYLRYLALDPFSAEASAVREEIVQTSLGYGVISPFTSFRGGTEEPEDPGDDTGGATSTEDEIDLPELEFEQLGNYPNPFRESTRIRFRLGQIAPQTVQVKIFDALGRLVRILTVRVAGPGEYEVVWDGRTLSGEPAPSGTYFYLVVLDDAVFGGKIALVR